MDLLDAQNFKKCQSEKCTFGKLTFCLDKLSIHECNILKIDEKIENERETDIVG